MSLSDRSSGRVDEPRRSRLPRGQKQANRGADGGEMLAFSVARVGRRQLAKVRAGLSDRDLAILHSLAALHFLTTRQVERLHFPVGELTPLAASRSSRRVLARLYEVGLVERLERRIGGVRAGSASYVLSLSPLGARLLQSDSRRRSREPSLAHLDHVLAVSELVVQLHEAERGGQLEVLTLQAEPECWRLVVAPHGGQLLLKPDLRLTTGVGEHELHWFVEVDRNSEHRPVLTRKCQTYLQAWRDGREEAAVGVFPRVLWIVPDDARAMVIEGVVASLRGAPAGMFMLCTSETAVTALTDTGGLA